MSENNLEENIDLINDDSDLNEENSSENKETSEVKDNAVLKEVLSWIKMIAVGAIIGILLVVFVIQRDNVFGDSMFPTLISGEVIFTEKISTYFHNYHRGDIVILDGHDMPGYNREEYLIKRIIALPGETIKIEEGKVYIKEVGAADFVLLDEPYLQDDVVTTVMFDGYSEVTLADNEYFCMGDNRIVSNDSRNLGPFSVDRIKGIAFIAVFPFDHFGLL